MSQRVVVGLLVALVALGLLVFFAERGGSPAAGAGPIVPGLQQALNDVERVTIAKAGGETVATIERHPDGWVVAEKNGYAADVGKLRQGLRALAEAKVLETKTSNPAFYDKLGVEDVAGANAGGVAVTITAPGKDFGTLILGTAVGTKQRYARRASEAKSYLLDRDPDFPKGTAQWLATVIVDVRGERIKQVTIKHPDGETLAIAKAQAPPSDLTPGTVVNFDVAGIPAKRELLYPGVANVIGNSLRELNLEDVERADGSPPERPVQIQFTTFDGLVVKMIGTSRGDQDWVTVEASVDPDQAARSATPAAAAGPEPNAASPAAPSPTPNAAAPLDPKAEAQRINERVAGWRYKIAGFQYDQMTRRMADLLKPVG
jgi:hypothetical protein